MKLPSFLPTKKMETHLEMKFLPVFLIGLSSIFFTFSQSQTAQSDAAAMLALKTSLSPPQQLDWSDPDPCQWDRIGCSNSKRVTRIQIGHQNLQGTLPPDLSTLSELERLELHWNNISGPLPTLNGLKSLRVLMLSNNQFSSVPVDFFTGMSSLQSVEIDNNPFEGWQIPESLKSASALQNFSAISANINGSIPDFFGPDTFPGLVNLRLALNNLEGELPRSLSGSQIESLWVNGQKSEAKLGGRIDVIQNMTFLKEIWLQLNAFSGPLPDFSGLKSLESLSIKDNLFTGPVPVSLINLASLKSLNLTNNLLQGPVPKFSDSVAVDMIKDSNSFCLSQPGDCDPRVSSLLSVVKAMDYPIKFADNWKGNDPCTGWIGITCNGGNITIVNFQKMGLTGFISPDFASMKSLQRLVLADNNLTGSIPVELVALPALTQLDVTNNDISGEVPVFKSNVMLNTTGNPDIGKEKGDSSSPSASASIPDSTNKDKKSKRWVGFLLFSLIGGFFVVFLVGLAVFYLFRSKQKRYNQVQSPNDIKITVAGSSASVGAISERYTIPNSETGESQMGEAGNMVISIQVLKAVTNNFSEKNILGQGGFGTVYKGEMPDGTFIAVKRMEDGVVTGKGIAEFNSEIAVLTKVRHRHLVALLGYCLDKQEKLLVYEYMPQGTLSRHLFNWAEEGLKPLEWTRRLTIALDVARGVEYLHGLAQQSFIHRDLKPSNILLGDNMRAKVSDFGLVRPAPEGKGSIQTRIAGTFGYLAPEYAVTGRVTTKVDVYSIGVILMELITGRKAIDDTQPDESMHLVTWFRRMYLNKDIFRKAIDPIIDLDEETLASISIVAELAGHCSAREPHQRPDMGHAVNVLSSLVEEWKPSTQSNTEDMYGMDHEMSLPNVLKRWQDFEGTSRFDDSSSYSYIPSLDNTITRP